MLFELEFLEFFDWEYIVLKLTSNSLTMEPHEQMLLYVGVPVQSTLRLIL